MDEMQTTLQEKAQAPAADKIDELSVEEYMAALMDRCGTPSTASQASPIAEPELTSMGTSPVVSATKDAQGGGRPGNSAAEHRMILNDLRKVANISTQNHIDACLGQRLVFEMCDRLTVTLVASLTSFAVIGFADSTSSPAFLCALLALLVSIVWGTKYLAGASQLLGIGGFVETVDEPGASQSTRSNGL